MPCNSPPSNTHSPGVLLCAHCHCGGCGGGWGQPRAVDKGVLKCEGGTSRIPTTKRIRAF